MRDGASWHLVITPLAEKELRRLPSSDQARIRSAIDGLRMRPPIGDVKKLQGTVEEWRLRVGDWRVRFRFDGAARAVVVTRVLPRGRAYRNS